MCLERYGTRQLSSRRPRCFFSCICQVHLHMEFLAATYADFPRKHFPSVMLTCKKKLEIPPPSLKWNLSLFLTASRKTFIKEIVKRGKKRQTRCFLTFHTKSCSQQDHKGLECQGEEFSFTLTPCFICQQSSYYL